MQNFYTQRSKILILSFLILLFCGAPLDAQKIAIRKKDKITIRKALTWTVLKKWKNLVKVGVHKNSDPYTGDTDIRESLPILSIRKDHINLPSDFPDAINRNNGWSGSAVSLTSPVKGTDITSLEAADRICAEQLGDKWQMAEFHDGKSSWRFWAVNEGNLKPGTRFWIYINDQTSNPWNLTTSNRARRLSRSIEKNRDPYKRDLTTVTEYFIESLKRPDSYGVEKCLEAGIDANMVLKKLRNRTPLMLTSCPVCQGKLLKAGADPNMRDLDGRSALFYRFQNYNPFSLKYLLEAGTNVNIIDNSGQSALFWGIRYDKTGACKKLIAAGASLLIRDKKNRTPLIYAAEKNRSGITKLLLERGLKSNPQEMGEALIMAAKTGNLKIVKLLLKSGANEDFRDSNNRNAFWYAQKNDKSRVIKHLKNRRRSK